jgi:hypothetical protein
MTYFSSGSSTKWIGSLASGENPWINKYKVNWQLSSIRQKNKNVQNQGPVLLKKLRLR